MKLHSNEHIQQEKDRDLLVQSALAGTESGRGVGLEAVLEWALRLESDDPLPMPKPTVRRRSMVNDR
jgi:hypothetical protein